MKRSLFLSGYVAIALVLTPWVLFAQEDAIPMYSGEMLEASAKATQNVNLSNVYVVSNDGDTFSLEFTVENIESWPQSGIVNETVLVGDTGKVVTLKSPEAISLRPKEVSTRQVTYPLLSVAPGTYTVTVALKTLDGSLLSGSVAGSMVVSEVDSSTEAETVVEEAAPTNSSSFNPAVKYNMHFIITIIAFALTLLVLVLALARRQKPPVPKQ